MKEGTKTNTKMMASRTRRVGLLGVHEGVAPAVQYSEREIIILSIKDV